MTVENELRGRLTGDAGVSALASARVYWPHLPDDATPTLPAVRLLRIASRRPSAMGSDCGIVEAIFQVDCFGATAEAATDLRDACRQALQRWRAAAGDPVVQDTFIDAERDHGLDPDLRVYRGALDIRIWFEE